MTLTPAPTSVPYLPSPLARVLWAHSITQADLAARSGMSKQTISDAYHGRSVSLETWVTLAKSIHVPLRTISPESADQLVGLVVE